jgi:cytochrome c553
MIKALLILAIISLALALACGSASRYDAPADHTKDKDGARHLPGLKDPLKLCVSCHGADLQGGTDAKASCFECHSKQW